MSERRDVFVAVYSLPCIRYRVFVTVYGDTEHRERRGFDALAQLRFFGRIDNPTIEGSGAIGVGLESTDSPERRNLSTKASEPDSLESEIQKWEI